MHHTEIKVTPYQTKIIPRAGKCIFSISVVWEYLDLWGWIVQDPVQISSSPLEQKKVIWKYRKI